MKRFAYAPLAIMLSVVPQIGAAEGETVPFGYLKMPFGGPSGAKQETTYGFSLAQTNSSGSGVNLFDNSRPPLLNLQFKGDELDALKLNGLNVLEKQVRYNVDGTTTTTNNIIWKYVLAGGLTLGMIKWLCERHEWSIHTDGGFWDCGEHDDSSGYSGPG